MEGYYKKEFSDHRSASEWMKMKNEGCRRAGNDKDIFVIVPGHSNKKQASWISR